MPPGFAHGFVILKESADFLHKTNDYYAPEYESCILSNDLVIGLEWSIDQQPTLAAKDIAAQSLKNANVFA